MDAGRQPPAGDWLQGAAVAVLSFEVDAEAPILAGGEHYAEAGIAPTVCSGSSSPMSKGASVLPASRFRIAQRRATRRLSCASSRIANHSFSMCAEASGCVASASARCIPHALYNAGTEPVRVLEVLTPGGFEIYFDEYEKIASKFASEEIDEAEHRRARAELGARYGVIWHDERIPEARARFGIGPWPHRSVSNKPPMLWTSDIHMAKRL